MGWLVSKNSLVGVLVAWGLTLSASERMQPHILMGDSSHCDSIVVRDQHLTIEKVCTQKSAGVAEVAWDGHAAVISAADEKASAEWIHSHSLLKRLSTHRRDLYWDGKKVDLGKVDVVNLFEAIPWQGGILVYGRTIPRRSSWQSWPFKGSLVEARDIEPFCAIYFDPNSLKGSDLWINGKVYRGLLVFPIPN